MGGQVPSDVQDLLIRADGKTVAKPVANSFDDCLAKCNQPQVSMVNYYDGSFGGGSRCYCKAARCDSDCFDRQGCEYDNNDDWWQGDRANEYWVNPDLMRQQLQP